MAFCLGLVKLNWRELFIAIDGFLFVGSGIWDGKKS
jgi:hypothetical protein